MSYHIQFLVPDVGKNITRRFYFFEKGFEIHVIIDVISYIYSDYLKHTSIYAILDKLRNDYENFGDEKYLNILSKLLNENWWYRDDYLYNKFYNFIEHVKSTDKTIEFTILKIFVKSFKKVLDFSSIPGTEIVIIYSNPEKQNEVLKYCGFKIESFNYEYTPSIFRSEKKAATDCYLVIFFLEKWKDEYLYFPTLTFVSNSTKFYIYLLYNVEYSIEIIKQIVKYIVELLS